MRREGDAALVRYAKQWDKVDISRGGLLLPARTLAMPDPVRAAIEYALGNIRGFPSCASRAAGPRPTARGATVGEKFDPLERVGIYVPGGTAPLVSTALMTVALAKEAKVREIVAVTPPPVNETLHYALREAGRDRDLPGRRRPGYRRARLRHRHHRARAENFSARATPTSSRRSGRWVGAVAIDQLPGPSEIAIVADDTARADFIAADLLAQAEHGAGGQVLFLTPSAKLLEAVERELARQLPQLSRGKHLADVLEHGCTLVLVEDVGEAIGLAEDFAPEHLTLIIKEARKWSPDRPQRRRDLHRQLLAGGRGRLHRGGRATSCRPAARPRLSRD